MKSWPCSCKSKNNSCFWNIKTNLAHYLNIFKIIAKTKIQQRYNLHERSRLEMCDDETSKNVLHWKHFELKQTTSSIT